MAWQTIDRKTLPENELGPGVSDAVKQKIRDVFLPRYPSKQAAMLPALHMVQDEIGYVSLRAMRDIAELLEVPPSAVMDVVTFYTHFWTHPRGEKTLVVCRSLTCELLGANAVLEALQQKLGIGEHETTPDGKFSLMTEECLAACDHAPCLMVNERMHKCVKVEDLDRLLADEQSDKLTIPRSDLYDPPGHA